MILNFKIWKILDFQVFGYIVDTGMVTRSAFVRAKTDGINPTFLPPFTIQNKSALCIPARKTFLSQEYFL